MKQIVVSFSSVQMKYVMDLINFIEINSVNNDRLGVLSREIILDIDFPKEKSDKEMFEYLDFKMMGPPNSQIYLELKRAYLKCRQEIKKAE